MPLRACDAGAPHSQSTMLSASALESTNRGASLTRHPITHTARRVELGDGFERRHGPLARNPRHHYVSSCVQVVTTFAQRCADCCPSSTRAQTVVTVGQCPQMIVWLCQPYATRHPITHTTRRLELGDGFERRHGPLAQNLRHHYVSSCVHAVTTFDQRCPYGCLSSTRAQTVVTVG